MIAYIKERYRKVVNSQVGRVVARAMTRLFFYPQKIGVSILGALAFAGASFFKMAFNILIELLVLALVIPASLLIALSVGYIAAQRQGFFRGVFSAVTTGLGLIAASAIIFVPLFLGTLISGLVEFIKSPLQGLKVGWTLGLNGVYEAVMTMFRFVLPVSFNWARGEAHTIPLDANFATNFMDNIHTAHRNMVQGRMTIDQIDALKLSEAEVQALQRTQSTLSAEEVARLEQTTQPEIRAVYAAYINVQNSLNTDNDPITLDRPENNDAIVLVKQYQRDNQWLPVPSKSQIYSEASFIETCQHTALNTLTRDPLMTPTPHTIDGVNYPTRYRTHKYYVPGTQTVLSQELDLLIKDLKARLQVLPREERAASPAAATATATTPAAGYNVKMFDDKKVVSGEPEVLLTPHLS